MPHLTLEHTDNLPTFNAASALQQLNHALAASGQFKEVDIKSRAIKLDTFAVGISVDLRGFVHVKLAILSGRSSKTKQELSAILLRTLKNLFGPADESHVQLCVEIQDIDRASYAKATLAR